MLLERRQTFLTHNWVKEVRCYIELIKYYIRGSQGGSQALIKHVSEKALEVPWVNIVTTLQK